MKRDILDYFVIRNSGLFDSKYYLETYPDVRRADIDPIWHYVKYGWKEGRNPSREFDGAPYLEANPDVKNAILNPLVHYQKYGKKEGRKAYPVYAEQGANLIPVSLKSVPVEEPQNPSVYGVDMSFLARVKRARIYIKNFGINAFLGKTIAKIHFRKKAQSQPVTQASSDNAFGKAYNNWLHTQKTNFDSDYVAFSNVEMTQPDLRLIAFYLPQFHPIPENDLWWGRGFTEWTNVSKAVPQFSGHYQPRLPGELGFYDLRIVDNIRRQVELAKTYGVSGFCFYYYWFNGKRLLEKPLELFLEDRQNNFPFCVCWANENWTRRWDGRSNEILISQAHALKFDKNIIHDLLPLFTDPRYIRIDSRPLVIVYRADILTEVNETVEYWRNASIEAGQGNPFILVAQTFGYNDPRDDGFDGAVEFPPHNGESIPEITDQLTILNDQYSGKVFHYKDFAEAAIRRIKDQPFRRFNTVCPSWDNDPRRPGDGLTFYGSSPQMYKDWLLHACKFAIDHFPPGERVVFINAWNEWGEGAYLEPDRRYGYAYLQATREALAEIEHNTDMQKPAEIPGGPGSSTNPTFQHYQLINNHWPVASNLGSELLDDHSISLLASTIDNLLADVVAAGEGLPAVSVLIPVYNHFEETLNCIKSIAIAKDRNKLEILLVDDNSTDLTPRLFSQCKKIRYLRNNENLGFLFSVNSGAQSARGDFLILLNNDTMVFPGWLDSLIDTFERNPNTGLVGSKLIYPEGRLQEAGGVIWHDASGINYGRDDDPDKPEYNYLREVDYCSGACICIPKRIWDEAGGFDPTFAPAYYEDTDLAFRIRQKGYWVLYQPFSKIIHLEGVTSGTDITSGVKSYQAVNKNKFYDRWKDVLAGHGDNTQPEHVYRNRSRNKRALVIDVCTPKPDRDSGSIDTYHYLLTLRKLGFEVSFISVVDANLIDRYVLDLQQRGIQCLYPPFLTTIDDYLKGNGKNFDIVFLFRAPYGGKYIDKVRKFAPDAKIIFNTVDLHFLRERREQEIAIKNGNRVLNQEGVSEADELAIMKKADHTILVSQYEQKMLESIFPDNNTVVLPLPREIPGCQAEFDSRMDIAFLGGYLHKPNVDAVLYFVNEIWPLITHQLPGCKFLIVGSNVPEELYQLENDVIKVVGYVEDLGEILNKCKLTVAPLRYGAGIKGKILTSLSYGVPCVASEVAVEGMGLINGESIITAYNPKDFSFAVVEVYSNQLMWEKLSLNGIASVQNKHSLESFEKKLGDLLASF